MKKPSIIPASRPRNYLVQHALFRKAGAHKRPNERQLNRAAERKALRGDFGE
jgi:hypothetical protein